MKTKSSSWKNILLLSSKPPLLGLTKDDQKDKPGIFKFYDFTKGGTDIMDQRVDANTANSKTRKWTKKILFFMIDICRVNS